MQSGYVLAVPKRKLRPLVIFIWIVYIVVYSSFVNSIDGTNF